MKRLQNRRIEKRARMQKQAGGPSLIDDEVTAELGPEPVFDGVNDPEHGQVAQALSRSEIDEAEADVRRVDDEASRHSSPWLLFAFLTGLFLVEWIGASMVFRAIQVDNPERAVLGGMLAIFAFFITYCTVRLAETPSAGGAQAVQPGGRSTWFYVVLGAYALLVIAVVALRVNAASGTPDGSTATDTASGLVMLFVTIGPAAVAEMVMRRWAPAAEHAKTRRVLRRRLAARERALRRAEEYMRDFARRRQEWRERATELRARYNREFKSGILTNGGKP